MKKTLPLLLILVFFCFFSCEVDSRLSSKPDFTITIIDEYSVAYIIGIVKNHESKATYPTYVNPGESITLTYDNGNVIHKIEFYSGTDIKTMSSILQFTYEKDITRDITLVIRDGKIYELKNPEANSPCR